MQNLICCNICNQQYDKMYVKLKKDSSLVDLRNVLEEKRKFVSLYFLNIDGNYFTKEEEGKILIFQYYKDKIIYFSNANSIKINLNGKFLLDIHLKNISLSKLRKNLSEKMNLKNKFYFKDAFILNEENFNIFEICKNNMIEIKTIPDDLFIELKNDEEFIDKEPVNSKDKNKNFIKFNKKKKKSKLMNSFSGIENEELKQEQKKNEEIKKKEEYKSENSPKLKDFKRFNSLENEKNQDNCVKYQIMINNKENEDFLFYECSPNSKLIQIKENFPPKFKNCIFLLDGYPITKEEYKVSEIFKNNIIYLKYERILNNCIKLNKKSIYEYYLYQDTKFTEEEEKECISLLLVGQTGTGKTTFLNSFINFLLNIKYSDNIRYLLVNEEKSSENYLSQTKEVNIYHIKSHNSYPPIKIIDTPGFGDTSGIEFDKKIAKMIYEKFKEIQDLSSVCILCKYNESRFDYSQRYIFNYIIDIFGKDMAENFMILFSFCDLGEISSKKCFEGIDSPFQKIIDKIKEPWYLKFNNSGYFAEKKSELVKDFFQMGNESFMKLISKLKSLKKIKLELSSEVNFKRIKLDKITFYIQNKIIYLANLISNPSNESKPECLNVYYCPKCKFFSDPKSCIICNKKLTSDYGYKNFNFNQIPGRTDNLLLKNYLEIFSNLFQLENIMKEYNNITLRDSQETIKEFLLQILNENNKNENIYSNIMNIKKNYENFINDFKNKSFSQNDFAKYLFNQLIIIKQ